jgi:protein-tyrosine phosphatase
MVKEKHLGWVIDSAGTGNWHTGHPPDKRAIAIMRKHGIDISGQVARSIRSVDFAEFDLIFAMDVHNYAELTRWVAEEEKNNIRLILNESWPGKNKSVPDPYLEDDSFEAVYEMLWEACESMIRNISYKKASHLHFHK